MFALQLGHIVRVCSQYHIFAHIQPAMLLSNNDGLLNCITCNAHWNVLRAVAFYVQNVIML